jgi:hypothetical protein
MKFKAIAAAVALSAVSVGANAAFDFDNYTAFGGGNGSGTAILTVLNDEATGTDTSISIGLGFTAKDFLLGNVAAGTDLLAGTDETALVDFLSTATGAISFDVVAVSNNGPDLKLGVLSTVGSVGSFDDSKIQSAITKQGTWIDSMNQNGTFDGTGNVATFSGAGVDANGGARDGNHDIGFLGQTGVIGDTLSFDSFLMTFAGPGAQNPLNTLTLSADGTSLVYGASSAIPLPAAAWVFMSAMLGLAGVARRRTA